MRSKLLIVCHDAGGAEILSALAKRLPRTTRISYLLKGPAVGIFQKKLKIKYRYDPSDLKSLVQQNDIIYTGSSWASDIENKAIFEAKRQKKFCATYLDHWTNYKERFLFQGLSILPSEIWVGDPYAYALACTKFPSYRVRNKPNYYYQDIQNYFVKLPHEAILQERILYLCEPFSESGRKLFGSEWYWGIHEKNMLSDFLMKMRISNPQAIIKVRLHPCEKNDKYESILAEFSDLKIIKSLRESLFDDIHWSTKIVGCTSMALVVGLLANKQVYSCLPKESKIKPLPHQEIQRIDLK